MTDQPNQYSLNRFLEAQEPVIADVKAELKAGQKRSHWMWYIFPQVEGLGTSEMAQRYALSSREEAEAYLDHSILGSRLRECTDLVNRIEGRSATEIFGSPDDLKFRSSMTLFAAVAADPTPFREALETYFDTPDPDTLAFLA